MFTHCVFSTRFFFIGNQVATSLTLKVKQLAKQLPSLKTLLKKISVELWVKKFYFFKYKFTEVKFLYNCFWHKLIVYYTIQQTFVLMKTSWRRLWRRLSSSSSEGWRLQDVLIKTNMFAEALRLQKTSSRRLGQDQYLRFGHTSSRRLQDVLKTSSKLLQDIFKTSSRRFEDVFNTSSRRLAKISTRCFQDVSSS